MTRLRSKRMKQVLQGLIIEVHEKEAVWDGSKDPPKLITLLSIEEGLECSKNEKNSLLKMPYPVEVQGVLDFFLESCRAGCLGEAIPSVSRQSL